MTAINKKLWLIRLKNDLEFFEHAKSMKLKEEKILSTKKYRDALEEEFIVVHLYSLKHI